MSMSTLDERKKNLAERLRARGFHDLADGIVRAPASEKPDFEEASRMPKRVLTPEQLANRGAAISTAHTARIVRTARAVTTCPNCEGGGHVVPFDGDGAGNVTVFRCLTCKTNFKNPDPSPGDVGVSLEQGGQQ